TNMLLLFSFFCSSSRPHPDLHSFPTRRSSDLELLELGLQTGRLRAVYGPGGEQAALRLFRKLPRGKELEASAREVTGALASLVRSEEHTSELQSRGHLVCRLLLEKKKEKTNPR